MLASTSTHISRVAPNALTRYQGHAKDFPWRIMRCLCM